MKRLNIVHVINSLEFGGAERVLCALVGQTDPATTRTSIITLLDGGPLTTMRLEERIDVHSLAMSRRLPSPGAVVQLAKHLACRQPALVVTWLNHSNLIGGLAARMLGGIPVIWNVRQSTLQSCIPSRKTRLVARCTAGLSRLIPSHTVFVGHAAQQNHIQAGYNQRKCSVIYNGFNDRIFRPDPAGSEDVRRELGLASKVPLVGLFGRFCSDKDHENFVRAAGAIHRRLPHVHFVLCGSGVTTDNYRLGGWIEEQQIAEHCHLLGPRSDIPRLTASLDLQVSSSLSEALPNVIGEAMACGVPCAVTDVGDSARLVGDTGRVVPPGDPSALAAACIDLLDQPAEAKRLLRSRCRRHIIEHFSFDQMVSQHFDLWGELSGRTIERRCVAEPQLERQSA